VAVNPSNLVNSVKVKKKTYFEGKWKIHGQCKLLKWYKNYKGSINRKKICHER
jgi:hypothetical protein